MGSIKAGERVMVYLRRLYAKLKLQINEAKSAVASALGRKFLGYELWVAKGREVKCAVAKKALDNFKARIRQLTRRSVGRSMEQVVEKLRPYLLGWKAYFGLAQTPKVWRELDEWLRHRLRAIRLKALEAAQGDLPRAQGAGGIARCRQASGGQLPSLVAKQ